MTLKLANHFLIAYPTLKDPNFSQAVVYLYEHGEEGAMGLIVNKPLKMKLKEVLEHLDISTLHESIAEQPVMMGGPIGQEHGFVLFLVDSGDKKDIFISSSKETLITIANNKGPDNFLVTLGYAGWEQGQLEKELQRNDWLVTPFDPDILFETPIEKRWHAAANLLGVDLNRLSSQEGHA